MDLNVIDNEFSLLHNQVKEFSKNISFKIFDEFNLDINITENKFRQINYPGIYLLEIKNSFIHSDFTEWINDFESIWLGEERCFEKCFTPNLKKKRIKCHTELKEWIPLYIGKSKNIRNRLGEHFFKKLNQTTFSLKLLERKNLHNNIFRLSTIQLDVRNYNIIMPIIENELRDKLNPIVGRQ